MFIEDAECRYQILLTAGSIKTLYRIIFNNHCQSVETHDDLYVRFRRIFKNIE